MEIKYNPKPLKIGFIAGIAFLLIAITSIIFGDSQLYFFFGIGLIYIVIGVYRIKVNYVTAKDGYLKRDFGKKILLKDIIEVKRFAGDYIFKTREREVIIDINAVDKKSLEKLDEFVESLARKWK